MQRFAAVTTVRYGPRQRRGQGEKKAAEKSAARCAKVPDKKAQLNNQIDGPFK
ncbi:hypothetical protein [Paraburkholderia sp. ZP32-5]|uniref:hypothetical protein n=1 Tax=Paraburkholderia sp. ZP32-5 TaxID=2883245 RepID=UPI001F416DBC|nr:hypothetical protein [Paraburkholderia sp. ZP32-5]